MKATVIRTFIINDKQLKELMKENEISEDELEDCLIYADSFELEDICDNDVHWDTDIDFEVEE